MRSTALQTVQQRYSRNTATPSTASSLWEQYTKKRKNAVRTQKSRTSLTHAPSDGHMRLQHCCPSYGGERDGLLRPAASVSGSTAVVLAAK